MALTFITRTCFRWNTAFRHIISRTKSSGVELTSLLYIPGDVAHKVVSILKPAVSFNVSDDTIETMKQNMEARGLKCNFDLLNLRNEFQRLEMLRLEAETLQMELRARTAKRGEAEGQKDEVEEKELKSERRNLRTLTKQVSHLEESVLPKILRLPNRLATETSKTDLKPIHSYGQQPHFDFEVASHETLGHETKQIIWNSLVGPNAHYFTGELAWFERAALDYFATEFEANNFTAFANPDFSKSIVVEGCGLSFHDPTTTFHLERDDDANVNIPVDLHLTGSASLMAFCAFHAKTSIRQAELPRKYYVNGRRYSPVRCNASDDGLFATAQSSEITFFVATHDENTAEAECDAVSQLLISSYERLGLHFRVVVASAPSLSPSESKRIEIQMWSPARQAYFTVSKVSLYDDFISKRLLMLYRKQQRDVKHFLHVVSGTAISIPSFVACVIENLQMESRNFTLPTELQLRIDQIKQK